MVPREGARTDDGLQDSAALPPAREPGGLGKRVSRRRQDLKLSKRELAGLAGVSVPCLQDLEAHHARPTQAALRRLAAALQTTPQTLLGAGTGQPPGRAGPSGQPVLETLTSAECFGLLSPGGVGRVAFTTADGPVVLPVNYAMARRTVIFRTAPDTLLAGYLDCLAGFEVDGLDEALSQGWSVLVTGRAVRVTSEAEVRHHERYAGVRPWRAARAMCMCGSSRTGSPAGAYATSPDRIQRVRAEASHRTRISRSRIAPQCRNSRSQS